MMKIKNVICMTLIAFVCLLTACTANEEKDLSKSSAEELKIEESDEQSSTVNTESDDNDETQPSDNKNQQDSSIDTEGIMITLYVGNDEATGFEQKEMKIEVLSPQSIIDLLIEQGTLTSDVQLMAFTIEQSDNTNSIELNLNQAFASYVSSMGTTGEYYTIGSICNTFLDAYECDQIKITIEGEPLTTGHAEYPGYMTRFE